MLKKDYDTYYDALEIESGFKGSKITTLNSF